MKKTILIPVVIIISVLVLGIVPYFFISQGKLDSLLQQSAFEVGKICVDCDDGVSCTIDSCDQNTGQCIHTPDNGRCFNGNTCSLGICSSNGCTYTPTNEGARCNCPGGLGGTCQQGECKCRCGYDEQCSDPNSCTNSRCENGVCTPPTPVQDGRTCSIQGRGGICSGGTCIISCQSSSDCGTPRQCQTNVCRDGRCESEPTNEGGSCTIGGGGRFPDRPGTCSNGACI